MTRVRQLVGVEFTPSIPRDLKTGVLYVSMEHATAIHQCMCGCGREVVTPFRRDSWTISYDGSGVSLRPSVGNGALPCRSHYIIRDNRIIWLEAENRGLVQTRVRQPTPWHKRLQRWLSSKS
jgi:hypothetical protein